MISVNIRRCFAVTLILIPLGIPSAYGKIYQCTDQQGRVTYQGHACRPGLTERRPLSSQSVPAKQTGRHFIWKAESDKGKAYLLGSIHFGSKDMYPLPAPIMNAFADSDALVVEANVAGKKASEGLGGLLQLGLYQDGSTLKDHVSADAWKMLKKTANKLEIPLMLLEKQKPWLVMLTLTGLFMKQHGYSEKLGIDWYFLKQAADQKPVIELESVAQQLNFMDELSAAEQEQMLTQGLRDLEAGGAQFKAMVDAWKNGELDTMDALTRESFDVQPESKGMYQALITGRNEIMANKVRNLTEDGRTYFVVVGAAHLSGQQGMIELLKAKGFKVSQH